jgi:hypothetical protein
MQINRIKQLKFIKRNPNSDLPAEFPNGRKNVNLRLAAIRPDKNLGPATNHPTSSRKKLTFEPYAIILQQQFLLNNPGTKRN